MLVELLQVKKCVLTIQLIDCLSQTATVINRRKLQSCLVLILRSLCAHVCIDIEICVCVNDRERLMRQVLALVTSCHFTTLSSLSVRASSYLSLCHVQHLNDTLDISHAFHLPGKRKCSFASDFAVMMGIHQTKQNKSCP